MALQNLLGDIALEATQEQVRDSLQGIETSNEAITALSESILALASAMARNQPRITTGGRMVVEIESGLAHSNWATTHVTSVNNPVTQQVFYRINEPWNFSSAAAAQLYQQIIVS